MRVLPGPVDSQGNITVPSDAGIPKIPISSRLTDGTPIDLSGVQMRFIVPGRINKVLPEDPSNPLGKSLSIDLEEASKLSVKGNNFSVLDESGAIPMDVWSGVIRRSRL